MPRAVPVPLRLRIGQLARQGLPAPQIARRLGLPGRTARRLAARAAAHGAGPPPPRYDRRGRPPQPCEPARPLQRHLRTAGLPPAPPGRRPARPARAARPHEVWQLGASERVRPRGGREVCWLRLVDEHTGAFLGTAVFPPRVVAAGAAGADPTVPAPAVRALGPAGGGAGG